MGRKECVLRRDRDLDTQTKPKLQTSRESKLSRTLILIMSHRACTRMAGHGLQTLPCGDFRVAVLHVTVSVN